MRRVHCRRCWQANPLLSRQCVHCGDVDGVRFSRGLAEFLVYVAGGTTAIVVVVWAAKVLF